MKRSSSGSSQALSGYLEMHLQTTSIDIITGPAGIGA